MTWHIANALHDASGQESQKLDAEVEQENQMQTAENQPPQMTRFLEEPKKDGHFTPLRVNQPSEDADTAFVGSWAGKDGKRV